MSEKTKHRIVIMLIAVTTVPYVFFVKKPSWGFSSTSLESVALYISVVFGYIGLSFLVWELVLGTRAISGLYFNNLGSKLKLHGKIGKYGSVFALLHPIFILLAFGENILYLVTPHITVEYEKHVTLGRLAFFILLIIWITSAIVRGKISYRPWKYLHYLSYPLIVATLLHIPEVGSSFHGKFIQFYWYCTLLVVGVSFILRARHLFGYGKVQYSVMRIKKVSPNVVVMELKNVHKNIQIKTGQYVYVQISLYGEEHPFTVLDHDYTSGTMTIVYKIFGKFTEKLASIAPGDVLYIDGPYGIFTEEVGTANEPAVFIAGGIGVTPFIKHALGKKDSYFFYANQSRKSAVFTDVLKSRLKDNFIELYSREENKSLRNVEHGYINENIIKKYIHEPHKYRYYICGPEGLMKSARNSLLSLGISHDRIHIEQFSF